MLKNILLLGAALLAGASILVHPFGPIKMEGSSRPPLRDATLDFATAAIFERSCQNCHSEKTEWPWYSYVAPMSWMIEGDVRHGRGFMNLSHWDEYSIQRRQEILAEMSVLVRNRAMPLPKYLLLHPEAKLSDAEVARLDQWARSERKRLKAASTEKSDTSGGTR